MRALLVEYTPRRIISQSVIRHCVYARVIKRVAFVRTCVYEPFSLALYYNFANTTRRNKNRKKGVRNERFVTAHPDLRNSTDNNVAPLLFTFYVKRAPVCRSSCRYCRRWNARDVTGPARRDTYDPFVIRATPFLAGVSRARFIIPREGRAWFFLATARRAVYRPPFRC